jgi:hypothetical protein
LGFGLLLIAGDERACRDKGLIFVLTYGHVGCLSGKSVYRHFTERIARTKAGVIEAVEIDRLDRMHVPSATSVGWKFDGGWLAHAEVGLEEGFSEEKLQMSGSSWSFMGRP